MKRLAAAALLATAATATACVPPPAPQTCPDAVRLAFGGTGVAERMVRISWRESRWDTTAVNPRSGTSGCAQLSPVHARRFTKLGYSWKKDRFDPVANIRVAFDLYEEQGTRPWRL